MPGEQNIGAGLEAPKVIESSNEADQERPDLRLEKREKTEDKKIEEIKKTSVSAAAAAPAVSQKLTAYEERQKQIENFLARELDEIYLSLPPEKRAEFKRVGEETAGKINKLLEKTKIKVGKIIDLIKKWLALIPGVNKFFLEQEAKIRADQIIKLKK